MNGLRFSDDEIVNFIVEVFFPFQHEFEHSFPVTDLKVKDNKTQYLKAPTVLTLILML